MSLSSSFTDFSLPELFKVIEQGKKSGCLTVCTVPQLNNPESKSQYYYIWFRQGRIIAAANRLNGQGLISKITQKGWVSDEVIEKNSVAKSNGIPLGLNLKTQGLLGSDELKILFASQVQQVREVFEIHKGVFKFDSKAREPLREMTGLSLGGTEVAVMILRTLKNWEVLAHILPDAASGIENLTRKKPQFRLNNVDMNVWELANGKASLKVIANQLHQPTTKIQQAAFRLMIADLVEEVPVSTPISDFNDSPTEFNLVNHFNSGAKKTKESPTSKVSGSFLQNLVGFLRSKD